MDSAREKSSGKIVEAESLWDLELVNTQAYECHGCGIQVFPASYGKGENRTRPYFSHRAQVHAQDCDIDGRIAVDVRARALIERVGRSEGFPVPFPDRVVLDERATQPPSGDGIGTADDGWPRTRANEGAGPRGYHGHTVNTIRPLCRTYIDFPHDRAHLQVSVPGCSATTYASLFARLPRGEVLLFPAATNLYCAPLLWSEPIVCESYVEWRVDAGEWDQESNRRSERSYRVRVHWAQWTTRQRSTVLHDVEVCRAEVIGSKRRAWLFCVGVQSALDPTLLVVHDHRLICGLVAGQLSA